MWVRRPQTHHCAALGQALAEMHEAGARLSAPARERALARRLAAALRDVARRAPTRVEPGLAAFVAAELEFLRIGMAARVCRQGVIHADLFPDNVFFLKGKLSGLIDFYFACNDLLAYDLAVCLNAWCFEADNAFNVTKGRALIQAYEARAARSSRQEREKLPILARGAALRFLLTRLYDWLTVPAGALVTPKDPLEYLRKLRFHQKVAKRRRLRDASDDRREQARRRPHRRRLLRAIPARAAGAPSWSSTAAEKELFGGAPETTNNRMELTAAIEALQGAEGAVRRRAPHRFRISPERHHQMDPRLEAQRLEDRRPQAGEERRPLAGARAAETADAQGRLALGARPCRP